MVERGVVREWHADEGWGVVDAPGAAGGCWVHYSVVAMEGYRVLAAGQVVDIDIERVDQDRFAFRAVEVRPVGATSASESLPDGSAAYRSTLRIRFDDGSTSTTCE